MSYTDPLKETYADDRVLSETISWMLDRVCMCLVTYGFGHRPKQRFDRWSLPLWMLGD
jgi:hypothetical protein